MFFPGRFSFVCAKHLMVWDSLEHSGEVNLAAHHMKAVIGHNILGTDSFSSYWEAHTCPCNSLDATERETRLVLVSS